NINNRGRPDPSTSSATTGNSVEAATSHHQNTTVSGNATTSTGRQPKRRRINRSGIHDVGEEIIIGLRSPEPTAAPSSCVDEVPLIPTPIPCIDLTLLDDPELLVMPKSPKSPQYLYPDGVASPPYVPISPLTAELAPLSPDTFTLPSLSTWRRARSAASQRDHHVQNENKAQEELEDGLAIECHSGSNATQSSSAPPLLSGTEDKGKSKSDVLANDESVERTEAGPDPSSSLLAPSTAPPRSIASVKKPIHLIHA
ncbi:hypothetical protein CVT24_001133, partial [Panaeolus cyanescens]